MAGPGNSRFDSGDQNVRRPAESNTTQVGDAAYSSKNGQDNVNVIKGQENRNAYPDSYANKPQELSPKAALENQLSKLIPPGDHHKYTISLSREKNGQPHIDIAGGDNASFSAFYNNVSLNCDENFWNNISKLTANGQKTSFSVGAESAHTDRLMQSNQRQAAEQSMKAMEPTLDTPAKPAADSTKPKNTDTQVIDSKLAHLIPEGVHLKFTQNNFQADKPVAPKQWQAIQKAVAENPDLVDAIRHKMGSHASLDIAGSHKTETAVTHDIGKRNADGQFQLGDTHTDLNTGAQTFATAARESSEPLYLGGHVMINGQDINLDPRFNKTIPANAQDGFPISAKVVQNSSGINQMYGQLHTEGNAKYFRVQRIVYQDGSSDSGQNLVDIPLTAQDRNGVARQAPYQRYDN